LPIIMIGNKCDLKSNRKVAYDEAFSLAQRWNIPYIETSAKTRENVDKAFSEIFVKIKDLKALKHRNALAAGKKLGASSNNLTPEEEKAVRADSLKKRIQKYLKNFKKSCVIS
jgi:GTPase SAR1 family protein